MVADVRRRGPVVVDDVVDDLVIVTFSGTPPLMSSEPSVAQLAEQ
jgi:hypothetical protein